MIPHLAHLPGRRGSPRPGRGPAQRGLGLLPGLRGVDGGHVTLGALEPQFWQNFCRLVGRPTSCRSSRRGTWSGSGWRPSSGPCSAPGLVTNGSGSSSPRTCAPGRWRASRKSSPTPSSGPAGSLPRCSIPGWAPASGGLPGPAVGVPGRMDGRPPDLGEHTDAILAEAGLRRGAAGRSGGTACLSGRPDEGPQGAARLVERLLAGDRRALARLVTWREPGTRLCQPSCRDIHARGGRAYTLG